MQAVKKQTVTKEVAKRILAGQKRQMKAMTAAEISCKSQM
jgi:hypothetical protein